MDVFGAALLAALIVVVVVVTLAASSIRILREYERAVVFRLGRLLGVRGPGLILLIPGVDRMVRVDLRTVTLDIPPQNLITRDNVPAKVNAVAYFRVIDAGRAIVSVERYLLATSQIAQTTLRSVLGKADLDMLLSEREQLNEALQHIIDEHTDPWGIKVTTVEIKDVEIPTAMQHAMALGAQAERERRAKIIHAEGEFQASQRLRDAADVISGNPASLQLRYLQTLTEIGAQQNSTVVFPLPMDLIKPFADALQAVEGRSSSRSGETEAISSSSPPSLTRPEPNGDQVSTVASGRSVAPGP
jgi:regulator of protease activity HflC (stomatin/prohibitin superfamily)